MQGASIAGHVISSSTGTRNVEQRRPLTMSRRWLPLPLLGAAAAVSVAVVLITRARARAVRRRCVVLWLRHRLRLSDNSAFADACATSPSELLVVYAWRHGHGASPTASSAFEAAAAAALDHSLRDHHNFLAVLCPRSSSFEAAASAVGAAAARAGAAEVVIDGSHDEEEAVRLVEAAAGARGRAMDVRCACADDAMLLPPDEAFATVGRCRTGGGGKVFRWAAFLSTAMRAQPPPPVPRPCTLPPAPPAFAMSDGGLCKESGGEGGEVGEVGDVVVSACAVLRWVLRRNWTSRMLQSWGEVDEAAARRRAAEAGDVSRRASQHASLDIGTTTRAAQPRVVAECIESESKNGCTSSEGGGAGGARPSRLSPFLRFGVISPRECASLGVRRRDLLWRDWSHLCWRHLGAMRQHLPVVWKLDGICKHGDTSCDAPVPLPGYRQLGWEDEEDALRAWCVGCTGAPIVDAGMRQLWVEGWMPRHVRLLCACCLTEGLGCDWRCGRDWFAYALIDHDLAINEAMWQNAGLVGVDPFYRSLRWEQHASGGGDDDDDETAAYVRKWLHELEAQPSTRLRWPPHLRAAAERPRPPWEAVASTATERRAALREAYWAAGLVGKAGVHVGKNGDVLGVGRTKLEELQLGKPKPTRDPPTARHAARTITSTKSKKSGS